MSSEPPTFDRITAKVSSASRSHVSIPFSRHITPNWPNYHNSFSLSVTKRVHNWSERKTEIHGVCLYCCVSPLFQEPRDCESAEWWCITFLFFPALATSCGTAVHKTHIFGHIMIEHRGTKRMTISDPNLNKEQKISSSKEKHAPNVRGAPRAAAA